MRPVNLIPPEDRRGERAPTRTGPFPYAILAVLGVALFAVAAITLANKQISDRKAEKSSLEAQRAEAQARADALGPYAEFASTTQARMATVTSLAQSRFDWVRVLRELSLVLPDDIWLTDLTGAANAGGETTQSSSSGGSLTEGLAVPTLSIAGCGTGHDAVAEFVEALKDIDGVTRVAVESSERGDDSGDSGGGGASDSCQTRNFIAKFQIDVAFDSAAVPAATGALPADPSTATTVPDAQVSDAQGQEQQARDSITQQTGKARNATDIIPGVAR
ncbi:MAG: PilN domain-containing protein [Solirubrobacterales bacterium]